MLRRDQATYSPLKMKKSYRSHPVLTMAFKLFVDFERAPPVSPEVADPTLSGDRPAGISAEMTAALDAFVKHVFEQGSVSKNVFNATKWIVPCREMDHIPEVDGVRDVSQIKYFVGHYDWQSLLTELVEFQETSGKECCLYLVPVCGQAFQEGDRTDVTYNSFIAPADAPPFMHLMGRIPAEEGDDVDEELNGATDMAVFKTLDELQLEWSDLTSFTKEQFDIIEKSVDVKILAPTRNFVTSFSTFAKDSHALEVWYDITMLNFYPTIPVPLGEDGKLESFPLILLPSIECTPPSYKRLIALCNKINDAFSSVIDGERVRVIREVTNYWQFPPIDIPEAFLEFANEGGAIPKGSTTFNAMFAQHFKDTREFIIDHILDKYLHLKRSSDDFEEWKGAPIEIDEELEKWDAAMVFRLMHQPGKEEWTVTFAELKKEIALWFPGLDDKAKIIERYNEFKVVVSEAFQKVLNRDDIKAYMKICKEDNADAARHEWLKAYTQKKTAFCLWPTVYRVNQVSEVDTNDILAKMENEHVKHLHVTVPALNAYARVLPPREGHM